MSTATLNIRTDSEVKEQADAVFKELGMNMSTAVNVFLRQAIREKGMPFNVTLNKPNSETLAAMKEAEQILNDPNRKTYASFKEIRDEVGV